MLETRFTNWSFTILCLLFQFTS